MQSFTRRTLLAVAGAAAFCAQPLYAQTTNKPLRLVVPFSTGSTGDAVARQMALSLTKVMSRSVVVESVPGAGGMLGTAQMVRGPKDGSNLGLVASTHVINPGVYKSMPFDSLKDVTPIATIGGTPGVLLVNPSVPAKNLKELIAYAKANPGKLNYGSSGNGTNLHLLGVKLAKEAGIDIVHIPYKGNGPMVTDLIGGQVQLAFQSTPAGTPLVKSGKLRAIGISTRQPSRLMPDVPTLAQQGLTNYDLGSWFMVLGPADMPAPLVAQLNEQVNAALALPELREYFSAQDYTMQVSTPAQALEFLKSESVKHLQIVKDSGVTLE